MLRKKANSSQKSWGKPYHHRQKTQNVFQHILFKTRLLIFTPQLMTLPEFHRAVHDYLSADSVQKLLVVPDYETWKWKIMWLDHCSYFFSRLHAGHHCCGKLYDCNCFHLSKLCGYRAVGWQSAVINLRS